jgi:hypothetical protein
MRNIGVLGAGPCTICVVQSSMAVATNALDATDLRRMVWHCVRGVILISQMTPVYFAHFRWFQPMTSCMKVEHITRAIVRSAYCRNALLSHGSASRE